VEDISVRSTGKKRATRFRLGSIRARLLLSFVVVVLLTALVITLASVAVSFQAGYTQVINHFDSVTTLKEAAINDWLQQLRVNLSAELDSPTSLAPTLLQTGPDTAGFRTAYAAQKLRFELAIRERQQFGELFLMNARGDVVLSTRAADEGQYRGLQPYFQGGLRAPGVYVQTASYSSTSEGINSVVAVYPVVDKQGHTLGVLAGRASLGALEQIMSERVGLGGSAETYLVGSNNVLLTSSHFPGYAPGKNYVHSLGIDAVIRNHSDGSGVYNSYREVMVLGVYRWLPSLQVALLAEEDRSEALQPLLTTLTVNMIVALASLLIATMVSIAIAGSIAKPVSDLAQTAVQIAGGDLDLTVRVDRSDEIGTLAQAFNSMTAQLRSLIVGLQERVTELNEKSQELRDSEAKYRRIVDTANEGIWVLGADGTTTFANARMAEMLGCSIGDIIGHPPTDFMFEEDAPDHLRILEQRRQGVSSTYERRFLRTDGQTLWAGVSSAPIFDESHQFVGSIAMLADITERKRAEEALSESQKKLALHLEQTLLGVIEWDTEFRAKEWNPAAEAIFGYSREEAIGRSAADLILPEAVRPQVESVWNQLLQQQGGQSNTNENVTKDGRTILCEWVNTPLVDDSGTVVGVMSLARDVTERRQAEELRIAKEAAEAANIAKSTFLANMSHEIRTPMNAILGFSQLMRHDNGLSERQRQQLDIINSSGEHLLALINDVLEMSKIEAGRISANPTTFNLHSLLDEMDSLFGLRAQVKALDFRVVRSDEVPRFVVTDENKLRQVFVNLLGNAVKFTDAGSVELRVGVRRDEEGKLRLLAEVEDTGRGIAPEDMDRLFQYFEQVGAGREAETGTGLGLAISREFVHLLGGEITVESQVGVGSVFRFDVAIEEAAAEAAAPGVAEPRRVTGLRPGEPRYRILVADDAPDNRELLVQLLEPVGFEVSPVSDGKQALEEFESWHPQLILMDMRMPVMDGYEATRRIRSAPGGADVAIIGVTASAFAEMRQGVFDAGVDEFVVKPFHEDELFDKIGRLLGVHYVYEQEAEEVGQAPETLDPAAVAALPGDLASRLRDAATGGDFDAILGLADEVERHDDRAAVALRTLAERFDAESILAALPGGETS